jgi:alkanesulfonate monooxygenase SsuD/methylene tetrahydromethanopterin reductase-like flavin-dependent oxidoreductase (luciferase family)
VKFIFFHLMPYRDLPADFSQRFDSVWVTPPNDELCDPRKVSQYYNEYLDQLELADRVGFDGLGVNEHHQNAYGMMSSPNLMASALARRTSQSTALCVMGNTLALYQPALRVAEEFAMLDCLSEGRLIAGFPVGTSMDVNHCYGITPGETRPRYFEAHDLITKAWTQPGPFPYNGRFNKLRHVNPWPKPIQKPMPPVWLGGNGSIETYEMALQNNYVYSWTSFFGFQTGKKFMLDFWDTQEKMGLEFNPYQGGYCQIVLVADTDEEARRLYEPHVKYFFQNGQRVPHHFRSTPGYRTRRSAEFAIKSGTMTAVANQASTARDWDSMVENGLIIAGSPDTVAERISSASKDLRIGNFLAILQLGNMPDELTRQNITLFGEKVIPKVRGLWSDHDYEHKWWPTGIQPRPTGGAINS